MNKTILQWLIIFMALLFLVLVQHTLNIRFFQDTAYLNLVLVFLIFVLIFRGMTVALQLAVLSGLFLDFLASSVDGTLILGFVLTLVVSQAIMNTFLSKDLLKAVIVLIIEASVVFPLFLLLISFITNVFTDAWLFDYRLFFTDDFVYGVILNLLLAYPLYIYYKLVDKAALVNKYEPV